MVAAAGFAAGVLIAGHGDDVRVPATLARVASVRVACESFLDSDTTQPGAPRWCSGMAEWMTHRLNRDSVGPQMMRGDPQPMSDVCRQWMAANPPGGTGVEPAIWRGSMVRWMADHTRGWSGGASGKARCCTA